jgi:sulfur carrier protein ThiS
MRAAPAPAEESFAVEITLKLFANLSEYLPHEHDGRVAVHNELPVHVAIGATVQSVIEQFRVPGPSAHIVLVNGVFVPRNDRGTRRLQQGDALAIWPPIAGG